MRFQQFINENRGLAYMEEEKDVTSGLSGLDFAGDYSEAKFKAVSGALQVKLMANLKPLKLMVITADPSYVPSMVRLYMQKVSVDRKAYEPKNLNSVWLPFFTSKGFDPVITEKFFEFFYKQNKDGFVPREIWFPNPKSIPSSAGNGSYAGTGGRKVNIKLIAGLSIAGVTIIGAAVYMMRK